MNEQQLQSVAERLWTKRGLTAKSLGKVIDVPVNLEAIVDYIDSLYDTLVVRYDESVGITNTLTREEFEQVAIAILAKRIQWVRQRTNGIREGRTIQISNTTPVPGPLFRMYYMFGKVESSLGAVFIPQWTQQLQEAGNALTIEVMRKYLELTGKLKHYYAFSEGLPSQDRGGWGYLIIAEVTTVGAVLVSPSPESKPDDAYLAAVIGSARMISGLYYGVSHGIIEAPDLARIEFFDAYGKGVGDGQ